MPIIKDFKQIVNDLKNFLHSTRPNVDTSPGTYTRDVIIDAPANEFNTMYLELLRASNTQSTETVSVEDVEKLGKNFQVYRKGPTPASGTVTFYSLEEPTTAVTISRGTQLATKATADSSSRQYVTTQDVLLNAGSFRVSTGRFEADVPARAVIGGTSSNVAAGALASVMNPISGISGVYNESPITNGTDFEPLSIYRNRIKTVIIGNNAGTAAGYYQTITRVTEVLDAKVAAIGTGPEELRRGDAGAVDIYVRGTVSTQAPTESFIVSQDVPFNYYFRKQPIDINSLSTMLVVGSVTGTMVQDADYTIVQDKSKLGGTTRGSDKLVFDAATIGEQISILYSYNSLIESLQIYMNSDNRKVLGSDLLINGAFPRQVDVTCFIRLLPGFTSADVISSVTINLTAVLNAYQIGEEVQQSDIVAVITGTVGVDDVTVPLNVFVENTTTGALIQGSSGNLVIPLNSYATVGDITVNVRV